MVYTAPTVVNGTPYDASLWQAALDEIARLSALADSYARGEMVTPVHGGSAAAFTNAAEVAVSTLTATFTNGRKAHVETSFMWGSTVANDVAVFRIRYRAGASIGTVNTATQAHIRTVKAPAANTGYPLSFNLPLPTTLSGTYTVALTAIRSSGSGNCQVDGTSDGSDRTFALLDMGA